MDAQQNAEESALMGLPVGERPSLSPSREATEPRKEEIDPLRRVFVPVEGRTVTGVLTFRTLDGTLYARMPGGSIRRITSKVNGKQAKRIRQKARVDVLRRA